MSRRVLRASAPSLLLLLGSAAALAALTLVPRDDGLVAAVFPPGLGQDQVLERLVSADAALVRFGAWEWIAVAASPEPDLPRRLRAAGAWLVLDPLAAGGCQAGAGDGG